MPRRCLIISVLDNQYHFNMIIGLNHISIILKNSVRIKYVLRQSVMSCDILLWVWCRSLLICSYHLWLIQHDELRATDIYTSQRCSQIGCRRLSQNDPQRRNNFFKPSEVKPEESCICATLRNHSKRFMKPVLGWVLFPVELALLWPGEKEQNKTKQLKHT